MTLQLVDGDCGAPPLRLLASVSVTAAERTSACVPVRAQTIEEVQTALRTAVRFDDLAAGPVSVSLAGFVNGTCQQAPLLCGRAAFTLPVTGHAVEIPLHCWGGSRRADYEGCAGGATSGAIQLAASDGGCPADMARRVRAVRVRQGDAAVSSCNAIGQPADFADLQRSIAPSIAFSGLQPGATQVTVWGFEDEGCRSDKLAACGQVDLILPDVAPLALQCGTAPLAGCPAVP